MDAPQQGATDTDFEHRFVVATEYVEFAREYHYQIHGDPEPLKEALVQLRDLAAEELKILDGTQGLVIS